MHKSDLCRVHRGFAGAALRSLLALFIFASSAQVQAAGMANLADDNDAIRAAHLDDGYFYDPLESLKSGGQAVFDSKGKWILLGAVGAVATARIFDRQMQATFKDKKRFGFLETTGNKFFGTSAPGTILGAGFWAYGNLAKRSREKSFGQAEIEALLATQIIVSGLKYAVRRERPDKSDSLSFPSGHNALAWTTAAVLHEFYGWKFGALGYATGLITMAGRMGANKHWFSDTVGGAAAGLIIGGSLARAHKKRLDAMTDRAWSMNIRPQFQDGIPGVQLTVSF